MSRQLDGRSALSLAHLASPCCSRVLLLDRLQLLLEVLWFSIQIPTFLPRSWAPGQKEPHEGRMKCQGLNCGPACAGRWQLPGNRHLPSQPRQNRGYKSTQIMARLCLVFTKHDPHLLGWLGLGPLTATSESHLRWCHKADCPLLASWSEASYKLAVALSNLPPGGKEPPAPGCP